MKADTVSQFPSEPHTEEDPVKRMLFAGALLSSCLQLVMTKCHLPPNLQTCCQALRLLFAGQTSATSDRMKKVKS
jgi:hypothetical protein